MEVKKMNDIFVPHLDTATSERLISIAKRHGYTFYGMYENKSVTEIIRLFYKYNHGNSKIIWHFYFNDIINKLEITTTSKSVKNSYPQLKAIPITYYWGVTDIFNYT